MKFPLKIILFFFSLQFFSQSNLDFHKVEEFIIKNQLDSASYFLNNLENSSGKVLLKKLIKKENLTYRDYYLFISSLEKRENVDYLKVLEYINREVKKSEKHKNIERDYFNTKWILITKLRDDAHLHKALSEQNKLEEYISNFNAEDKSFLWAKTKLTTHPIVMYLIEKKVQEGKELVEQSYKTALALNDINLQITFLHYKLGFLIYEKKLKEYIQVCEQSLELEKKLSEKSYFYYASITSLINAYIFKGGYEKKVNILINELYNSYAQIHSYSLYAQLISTLDENSPLKTEILNKFKVNNVLDLVKKFENLGKDLNSNDFFKLINKCSVALAKHKYYKEALDYKHQALELTRKIYSEELSKSLAEFETQHALYDKEIEIDNEKQKTRLYLIIALFSFFLLVITFTVLKKIRKYSGELESKNILVKKSLEEKEIIIKEMHHRVKNNFQLITSLLDLQTNEIEDKRLIEILNKGKSRIKSMSLIHQKLYNNNSGLIKFDEFINLLVKELTYLYKFDDELEIKLDVNEIYFDVDTAIPLALILNELITNSLKYAFYHKKEKTLLISLYKEQKEDFTLIVKDSGLGLAKDFNINKLNSSGLKLVSRLVKQLQGNLKITNESGAKFQILFKDTVTRKQTN